METQQEKKGNLSKVRQIPLLDSFHKNRGPHPDIFGHSCKMYNFLLLSILVKMVTRENTLGTIPNGGQRQQKKLTVSSPSPLYPKEEENGFGYKIILTPLSDPRH